MRLVGARDGTCVTMGELVEGLDDRAFGFLMLLLALPNALPMPGIPFLSTVTGTPLAFFAGQLALGHHKPWLPQRLLRQSFNRPQLLRALERLAPAMRRVERVLKPRLPALSTGAGERAAALASFGLAVILALPIPGGNFLPALAIVFFALGIVERDGRCIIVGAVIALLAIIVVTLVLLLGVTTLLYFVSHPFF